MPLQMPATAIQLQRSVPPQPELLSQGARGADVDRMLIQICCSETSKLSEAREASRGCQTLRVTKRHD